MSNPQDDIAARIADPVGSSRSSQDFVHGPQVDIPGVGSSGLTSYATSSTWIERLVLTLLSYSIVLLPIAFIVIATRYKLFPKSILASALVQWFVYGSASGEASRDASKYIGETGDVAKSLISDQDDEQRGKLSREPKIPVESYGKQSTSGSTLEFLFCLVGLQVSYLIWGLLQEKIMTTEYAASTPMIQQPINDLTRNSSSSSSIPVHQRGVIFSDSQFLVFINRLMAFVTAILAFVYTRHRQAQLYSQRYTNNKQAAARLHQDRPTAKGSAPLYKFVYSSLSNILSSWCQYEALKYVNFPTQCLSKSCKVIPVMLMSRLLMNKRYPYLDYFCALLLALGMFIFMLNQPLHEIAKHSPSHHPHQDHAVNSGHHSDSSKSGASLVVSGITILALYLTFDSFTSNWQQKLYARYDISNWQMMAASNFYSLFLTLTSLHQLGNLRPAFDLLASSKVLMRDCLVMSLMSSVGQMFVYYTIKRFGSVIFAVIMTLRQFLSILLSCTIYKHQLNIGSTLGLVLVFLVVGFQVWHKSAGKRNKKVAPVSQVDGYVLLGKRDPSVTTPHHATNESFATFGRQLLLNNKNNGEPPDSTSNGRTGSHFY